jgi:S1-C subfamily serine protease
VPAQLSERPTAATEVTAPPWPAWPPTAAEQLGHGAAPPHPGTPRRRRHRRPALVLSSDGLILTNNHVVADAGQGGRVQVQLSGGSTATAVVVGTSPGSDLAVLRADGASGLTAATFGDSDALEVGDTVLAVGSIGVGFAIPSQRVAQVVGQLTGDTQMLATSSATG